LRAASYPAPVAGVWAATSRRSAASPVLAFFLLLGSWGCGGEGEADPLLILAASDLQFAFEEIVPVWEERAGVPVNVVLGSTGNLATQLRHGAPGDLFFAADEAFIDDLIAAGRVEPGSRTPYAFGRLALVSPPGTDPPATLDDLGDPRWDPVALANPEHAPYGRVARQALVSQGQWGAVQERVVFGENIAQAYQLVRTGNAAAGIVALSLVEGAGEGSVPFVAIPREAHPALVQVAGVLADSSRREEALEFLHFVMSEEGQGVLARFGFDPPVMEGRVP
jgi:molybdate transport system substrate-binding protein